MRAARTDKDAGWVMRALGAAGPRPAKSGPRTRAETPTLAPGIVARQALVARLAATPEAGVALLVAPAGYGKTTVLTEWAGSDPRRFAWLRVTRDLDDGRDLYDAVTVALDRKSTRLNSSHV